MFGYYTRKLKQITQTPKYQDGKYRFEIIDNLPFWERLIHGGNFVIKNKKYHKEYIDLVDSDYSWRKDSQHFKDCIGSAYEVYTMYRKLVPKSINYKLIEFK